MSYGSPLLLCGCSCRVTCVANEFCYGYFAGVSMGKKQPLNPQVTIIGCGTPTPLPDRFGSSYVVQVGDEKLLFDCGPASTW